MKVIMLMGLLWISGSAACNEVHSLYVSLQEKSCKIPSKAVSHHYLSKELGVIECQTGVTVRSLPLVILVVSSNERSWVDFALGNTVWSSEDEIVYEKDNQFGYFPNVGSTPVEIRMSPTEATGLIFRVTAQDPEPRLSDFGASNISRLFVFGFKESNVCFVGLASDNAMARSQLDSRVACKRMLKAEQLQ